MANPYYIPPRSTVGEDFYRLGHLGLQLYGLKQHGDIARANQALTAQELGMRGESLEEQKRINAIQYGSPEKIEAPAMEGGEPRVTPPVEGLHQRELGLRERALDLTEQTRTPRQKNWGLGDYTMFSAKLRMAGFEPDKLEFMKELKGTALDNKINRGQFADNLAVNWEQGGRDQFVTQLQESVDAEMKKMDPMELSRENPKIQKKLALIDAIQNIPAKAVIPTFFPDIARQDAETWAALQSKEKLPTFNQYVTGLVAGGQKTPEEGSRLISPPTVPAEKGTWSEPYNIGGATVQKNSLTGEIRTAVSRPPEKAGGETLANFKTEKLKEMWHLLPVEARMKVVGALPADKEITDKNILDVYGSLFIDDTTKKALAPLVTEITKSAAAKRGVGGEGKKLNMLPEGSKQIGTYNGKPVYETPDGRRIVQE